MTTKNYYLSAIGLAVLLFLFIYYQYTPSKDKQLATPVHKTLYQLTQGYANKNGYKLVLYSDKSYNYRHASDNRYYSNTENYIRENGRWEIQKEGKQQLIALFPNTRDYLPSRVLQATEYGLQDISDFTPYQALSHY